MAMADIMNDCLFCKVATTRPVIESEHCYSFPDAFPVSPGHTLIVPKRHINDATDLTDTELLEIFVLYREANRRLKKDDPSIKGFNLGFNVGACAGQTVFHVHFHVIPRRVGDMENPKGGIRHCIKGKGTY
jgi:diadenosine tetraphosphate (Ap4A) HIT family hydrolase